MALCTSLLWGKFWILGLKVCLNKLGIEPGLYGKSVLYLKSMYEHKKEESQELLPF